MSKKDMKSDIKIELENLERLSREMKELLSRISDKPSFIEIRGAASILHDFYSGVEKIFERIALSVDKNLPKGENWHIELLIQMTKPFLNVREPVISKDLFEKLKKNLDFRHLFRHIYGFELKWERFKELCVNLDDVLKQVQIEIEGFLEGLEQND